MIFVCGSSAGRELTVTVADSADAPLLEVASKAGNAAKANAAAATVDRIFMAQDIV
jgi:hypothetical protein